MKHHLTKFVSDESGAVTVDWVVLTAGIVMMGVVFAIPIGNQVARLSTDIGEKVDTVSIAAY